MSEFLSPPCVRHKDTTGMRKSQGQNNNISY